MHCLTWLIILRFISACSYKGMTWPEVQQKYRKEALLYLGSSATEQEISHFVYRRIVDKACSTSAFFDRMATDGMCATSAKQLCSIVKSPNNGTAASVYTNGEYSRITLLPNISTSAVDTDMRTETGLDMDPCETQFAPRISACCRNSGNSGIRNKNWNRNSSMGGGVDRSTIAKLGSKIKSVWSAAFNVLLMLLAGNLSGSQVLGM